MKKVQDYYFKKAKQEKFPARSVYKLSELQNKHKLLQKGDAVLDLGCHPGSWSLYAAQVVGAGGLVVGVDLQSGKLPQQEGQGQIRRCAADVFSAALPETLLAMRSCFNVVLSDMAPQTTGSKWQNQQQSLRLSRRALEIAAEVLCPGGNFYCKVFEGEDFRDFVAEVRGHFRTAKVVKPKSSRPESREVFVLGTGFNKNRKD